MGTQAPISEVIICNQSLARIGSTQTITSFLDGSNEANQCAIFYPADRDALLSDFPWPWAEAYAPLVQVAGPETTGQRANAQWIRSYRYPSDCLKMRQILMTPPPLLGVSLPQTTGTFTSGYATNEPWRRPVGNAYPVSYGLSNDSTGVLIVSDFYGQYGLTAIYTQAVSDPTQFANDFADTLSWRVAADLAMALGFSEAKRKWAEEKYNETINKTRSTHFNEMNSDIPYLRRQSGVIRARWGG